MIHPYFSASRQTIANACKISSTPAGAYCTGSNSWSPSANGPYYGWWYVRDQLMLMELDQVQTKANDWWCLIHSEFSSSNGSSQLPDNVGGGLLYSIDVPFDYVYCVYNYYRKSGNTNTFNIFSSSISVAMDSVTVTNHLVFLDGTRYGWGFQDQIGSTGYELMCSLFRYRAYKQMAIMAVAAGRSDIYTQELNLITKSLEDRLWDNSTGYFRNASITNNQHHCVGSAYAVTLGACSTTVRDAIVAKLIKGLPGGIDDQLGRGFVFDGACRYLPENESFTSNGGNANGTYQNGGYWPFTSYWVATALSMSGYVALADSLIDQLAQRIETDDFYEWWGKDGNAGAGLYGASAGFPAAYEYQGYTYTASIVPAHSSSYTTMKINDRRTYVYSNGQMFLGEMWV